MRPIYASVVLVGMIMSEALGGDAFTSPVEMTKETDQTETEYSLSIATYLAQHGRDYANPNFLVDRGSLHLETRYNYEAIKTGSVWLGYNFSVGKKLVLEGTPMIGGVFGDITGIAPGYAVTIGYDPISVFTQGQYFFDTGNKSNNFFYNWSEFTCSPSRWFKFGLVLDRTKALGSDTDVRRGPFIGFKYKKVDLTVYWLGPGSKEGTFVFGTAINF